MERTRDPIRLGMVGGGQGAFIGAVHRLAARMDGNFKLVAGALSSDAKRARDSADELGIHPDRSYESFERMAESEAAREDGIEAVSIVTPNHMHCAPAKAFLKAGIHVICDKPLASTLEDAIDLREAAEKSPALFALTHNYTGYPMIRQARNMVERGEIGKIRLVQAEYVQDWLAEPAEKRGLKQAVWRTDPEKSGPGGSIGDIGTHAFNLACFVSGLRATELSADLDSFVPGRKVDDNAHVMLRFERGAKGMLWSSQVAPGNENALRLRVYGEAGGLEWEQENPNRLWHSPFGQPRRMITRGGHGSGGEAGRVTRVPPGHPEGYLEGFANIYSEIAMDIRARKSGEKLPEGHHYPTIHDGVLGMRFIAACVDSSRNGSRWVSV